MAESLPDQLLAVSIRVVRTKTAYERTRQTQHKVAHWAALSEFRKLVPSVTDEDANRLSAVIMDISATSLKHLLGMKDPKPVPRATLTPGPRVKGYPWKK